MTEFCVASYSTVPLFSQTTLCDFSRHPWGSIYVYNSSLPQVVSMTKIEAFTIIDQNTAKLVDPASVRAYPPRPGQLLNHLCLPNTDQNADLYWIMSSDTQCHPQFITEAQPWWYLKPLLKCTEPSCWFKKLPSTQAQQQLLHNSKVIYSGLTYRTAKPVYTLYKTAEAVTARQHC